MFNFIMRYQSIPKLKNNFVQTTDFIYLKFENFQMNWQTIWLICLNKIITILPMGKLIHSILIIILKCVFRGEEQYVHTTVLVVH